jgi:tellurite methyltransferase
VKRDQALTALSRDHHHALVMAQSLKRDAPARLRQTWPLDDASMVAEVQRRFERELEPHFVVEEEVLLVRSADSELEALAQRVRDDHAALRSMAAALCPGDGLDDALHRWAMRLEAHVRFEEREWFVALERVLGSETLATLAARLHPIPVAGVVGFQLDDDDAWVAELDCGHRQHVRHQPPWQRRAWVQTKQGRDDMLGTLLSCPACRMPNLPADAAEYKRVGPFDTATVPKGLLSSHRLKAGSWGEIVVTVGRVLYVLEDEHDFGIMLGRNLSGVVAPERPHHIEPQPGANLYIRFLR